MSNLDVNLGVDLGATLCKFALRQPGAEPPSSGQLVFAQCPSEDLAAIERRIRDHGPSRVLATGGGAEGLRKQLGDMRVDVIGEFEAWVRGAEYLAELAGEALPERYLLVSLGTGTSVLSVGPDGHRRAGGSALGGGTLLGLGELLIGSESFPELASLAARGDRREVDLLVGDIYGEDTPLPPEINAASFGKLASKQREDLAHALMGMVGENVGLICAHLLPVTGSELVLFCGSTLAENRALGGILRATILAFGGDARFLPDGAYCGAVGALCSGESGR